MATKDKFRAKNGIAIGSIDIVNELGEWIGPDIAVQSLNFVLEYTKQLNYVGPVSVETGALRWYPDSNILITNVFLTATNAPVNGSLIMSVKKSGNVISTVTLAEGQNKSSNFALSTTVSPTEFITVDVTSANYAANASLVFSYRRTQ